MRLNSAPTPLNKSFTVHGYTLLGDLLSGDSDPDGDSLNFDSIQTYPQHGSLFTSPTLQTPAYSPNSGYSYVYDAASKLTSRTLPNSVVTTYTYDGLDRLTRLKDAKSNTVIADNNYTYNTAGRHHTEH